jgi:3-oxoacyl-[acyl-carrier protein] reductase
MDVQVSNGDGIRDQVAVITGGAGSIGLATAAALLREGARVWLLDLPAARDALRDHPINGQVQFLEADVTDADAVRACVAEVHKQSGRLDIAVACAGVAAGTSLAEITAEEFDRICSVNLRGAFTLLQAVEPGMTAAGAGKVVLLGSVAGHQGGVKSGPHYVAAKAGVHGLTRWAAKNLGPHGVHVNAVAPGPVLTAMWAGLGGGSGDDELHEYPLRRLGRPEDVAEAIVFLAGPGSNWITGVILDVNGGFHYS